MSRRFEIALEYDGEDPVRNTFLCEIDELNYSVLRDYDGLYYIDTTFSGKERAKRTSEMKDYYVGSTWVAKVIAEKIESIKQEMELDTELEGKNKEFLNEVISDLQRLYDIAIEKCNEHNISPEDLYINWWINQ
jgi:predicted S18 family serine protease